MLRNDPIAHDPRRERDVDEREPLPKEPRPPDLRRERPERGVVLLEQRALPLGALRLDEARVRGHDDLGGVVRPDARVAAVDGVRGEEVRLVRGAGEGVLEELAEHERLVERTAFVLDRRDEALRVDRCARGVKPGSTITRARGRRRSEGDAPRK